MESLPDCVFCKELPFFQMASTAAACLSTYPLLLAEQDRANLKPRDYIVLTGIAEGDRHFFPYDIRREAIAGTISMDDFLGAICMMLMNTAYESVKGKNDRSPTFEFFRHVRNASSHLNRFTFHSVEPRLPATWRSVHIDHTLKGTANHLHDTGCFGRILGVADAFTLLWDVEQIIKGQQRT